MQLGQASVWELGATLRASIPQSGSATCPLPPIPKTLTTLEGALVIV